MSDLVQAAEELRARIDAATVVAQVTVDDRLADLSDDTLAAVTAVYPKWQSGTAVTVGQVVQHDGVLYRAVQAHTSQADWTPDKTPALWTPVRETKGAAPDPFVQPTGAADAYSKGDRVTFEGAVWESVIDANVWSPSAYPAGWKAV